jgi:hypothetical protein
MFPDDIADHLADWPQIQTATGSGEAPSIQPVNSGFFLEKTRNLVFMMRNRREVSEKPKV